METNEIWFLNIIHIFLDFRAGNHMTTRWRDTATSCVVLPAALILRAIGNDTNQLETVEKFHPHNGLLRPCLLITMPLADSDGHLVFVRNDQMMSWAGVIGVSCRRTQICSATTALSTISRKKSWSHRYSHFYSTSGNTIFWIAFTDFGIKRLSTKLSWVIRVFFCPLHSAVSIFILVVLKEDTVVSPPSTSSFKGQEGMVASKYLSSCRFGRISQGPGRS